MFNIPEVLEDREREYTVHFQKGTRVGARSLRMVRVNSFTARGAAQQAKRLHGDLVHQGYRVTRVDHFDEKTGRTVVD